MKLIPFLSKPKEPLSSSSSWPWAACGSSKTLSFRAEKIMDSGFVAEEFGPVNSESSSSSFVSTIEVVEEEYSGEESIENVIREVRESSGRLFFDHLRGETTSFIVGNHLVETLKSKNSNINDCVSRSTDDVSLIEMDSRTPFEDFKKSMEEMVEAYGFNLKDDWNSIHQLLSWYLKVNDRSNHSYIVGAFIDLLVSLEYSSTSSSFSSSPCNLSFRSCDEDRSNNSSSSSCPTVITQSPISTLSLSSNSLAGPCLLTLFEEEEDDEEDEKEKEAATLDDDHHHHRDVMPTIVDDNHN